LPGGRLRTAIRYVRFGGLLFVDGLLWRWYTSLDTFLLGRWSGTQALGFYSLGQQVANMPLEKVSTVVNDVSLPAYAQLGGEGLGAKRLLLETVRTHAVVGLPMFWGIASVASIAVPLLFGDKWQAAVLPLVAFALIAPVRLMGSVETPAMTGIGEPAVLLRTKWIIVPCMTLALLAGCWFAGVYGACAVWLTVFPVCYGFAFRYVLRAAGVAYVELWHAVRGPLLAAVVMLAAVELAQLLLARFLMPAWVLLSCTVIAGAAVYGLSLRATDAEAFALTAGRLRRVLSP
jgi:O-antigen/teichoic acid export membrane protein